MRQYWLLLKACRRGILGGMGCAIFMPLLAILALSFIALTKKVGLGNLLTLSTLQRFFEGLTPHLFDWGWGIVPIMALLAGMATIFATPTITLRTLPIPVTNWQLTNTPLMVAMGVWVIQLVLLFSAMALGVAISGPQDTHFAVTSIACSLPFGLLIIFAMNRGTTDSKTNHTMVYLCCLPSMVNAFNKEILSTAGRALEQAVSNYPILTEHPYVLLSGAILFTLFAAFLLYWDTPRLRGDDAQRVQLQAGPDVRRVRPLTIFIEAGLYFFTRTLLVALLSSFAYFHMASLYSARRPPFWIEQAVYASVALIALIMVLRFTHRNCLPPLLCGQFRTDSWWAQATLGATHHWEKYVTKPRTPAAWLVRKNPGDNAYTLHFHDSEVFSAPVERQHRRLFRDPSQMVAIMFAALLPLLGYVSVSFNVVVNPKPSGSAVLGDARALPPNDYELEGTFAQHYVAIDLGENWKSREPEALGTALRSVLNDLPNPEDWISSAQRLDGMSNTVPARYRIEITQPDARTIVVQSMGLHWNPPGHLAYGLANLLRSALSDLSDARINEDYEYQRELRLFEASHGFLDNQVHWNLNETNGNNASGYVNVPSATDVPIYVRISNTTGKEDGRTWASGFNTIQEGIDAAFRRQIGGVWVAAGVYNELRTGDGSVQILPGVHLYGGFAGHETTRTQRDCTANVTVIDGSRSRNGEAAIHVVDADSFSTLDGFTITGGVADGGSGRDTSGGGLIVEGSLVNIANCIFEGNSSTDGGGAVYLDAGTATFEDCVFRNNETIGRGGAIIAYRCEATLRRCVFTENYATENGQAFSSDRIALRADSCLFVVDPLSVASGSLIEGREYTLVNCTVVGNGNCDLLGLELPTVSISNSILWSTRQDLSKTEANIRYSIVQGGAHGQGNLDLDPRFVDPDNGDYRLRPDSPAIDVGFSEDAAAVDLDGNPRIQGSGVDMGAYEFVPR